LNSSLRLAKEGSEEKERSIIEKGLIPKIRKSGENP
jgi:hypothetical protein